MDRLLPEDSDKAILVGRLMTAAGPTPVMVRDGQLFDMSEAAPTVADLFRSFGPEESFPGGRPVGAFDASALKPVWEGRDGHDRLIAPIDLQCVKASGVTFAVSAVERVIEERARGNSANAEEIRGQIQAKIGVSIGSVKPGSEEAARLKSVLIEESLWSQYLEVAIGPDAEIFTKTAVLASVGSGEDVGIRADSEWNNPEPEVVLVCDPQGRPRGAALGNDVNLRDFEGRSALLLGKAKDNNASCAIGPFIRLFDEDFSMDDVRSAVVSLEIMGDDGYRLTAASPMTLISRDPLELVDQTIGLNHQYPDGFALFLGTMYAPIEDRFEPGRGFTHSVGDIVRVSSPKLGTLENRVVHCQHAPHWEFGISDLMRNLVGRNLITGVM